MAAPKPKGPPLFTKKAWAFAATFAALGLVIALVSLRGEPQGQVAFDVGGPGQPSVTPVELAQWGIEGRRDFAIVDLRAQDRFKAGHVRGAVNCGSCHGSADEGKKAQEGETFVDLTKKLVVYTETGAEAVQLPKVLAENPRLFRLEGGYAGWRTQVLAPVTFGGEADDGELAAKKLKEAIRAFYAGERPATGDTAKLPITPIRRENTHKPAGAAEGC
jgi:rhodanese-related sulfurtransferase